MKSVIYAVIAASALAIPVASFAQSNAPLTRSEVKSQLIQLEQAGYDPAAIDPNYPKELQAAEARVSAQNLAEQTNTSYGSSIEGSSHAGGPATPATSVERQ